MGVSNRQYYGDIQPWRLDNNPIQVVEDNDHLGQIISGCDQVRKNVDNRILKARNSLYSLLGGGFLYKCKLSPSLKIQLYRTLTCPILSSGLSTFCLSLNDISHS